eukprot:12653471-Prorocentrum_lima.AAC.1
MSGPGGRTVVGVGVMRISYGDAVRVLCSRFRLGAPINTVCYRRGLTVILSICMPLVCVPGVRMQVGYKDHSSTGTVVLTCLRHGPLLHAGC